MADNKKVDDAPSRNSTTWLIKKGDTLVNISREVYGSGDYWMYIYNANRGKIHNADYIDPLIGTTIDIPPIRNNPINGETAVAFSHKGAKFWTIQYGDTLVGISKAVYGTTKYSRFLYEVNSEIIEKPDSLKKLVGYPLIIPQNPEEAEELPPEFALGVDFDKNKYNYSVIIQHGNTAFQPAVEDGIKIEWSRGGIPGKMTFTVLKSATQTYLEGDKVKFYFNKRLIFVGYVFTKHRTKKGHIETTAYDQTRYLKNKFAYVFQDKTASEIIKDLCKDFDLQLGYIQDSKYKIPAIAEENSEAFDIILNATEETLANTGELYNLFDYNGAITYKNVLDMKSTTLITETTAEDFDYTSSIDERTYNRIILYYKPTAQDDGDFGEGKKASFINFGGSFPPWVQQADLYSPNPNGGGFPGQCTWYCGDRLAQLGVKNIPNPMGNGGKWHITAQRNNIPCYYGKPFPGAIADMQPIHVAFVEKVNSDGSIDCSAFWGRYEDYTLHAEHYSPSQVANMWFIDFGVRASNSSKSSKSTKSSKSSTRTNKPNSSAGLSQQNVKKVSKPVLGSNVTRWANYVVSSASKYNIPADFVGAIILHESSGLPNSTSSAGAMGLMQLMPDTARGMGVANPYDPQQNIEGGCKYLAYLVNKNGNKFDPKIILRMYWGGELAINNSSLDTYWADIQKLLPNEFTGMSGTCSTLNGISGGDTASVQVFKAQDEDSMNRWGVLQYFEQVNDPSIGQAKADALLELYNRKTRDFTINDAIGDIYVRGGTMIPVYLNIGDTMVNNYMLVDKVTHKFYHHKHTMDLQLEGAYHD